MKKYLFIAIALLGCNSAVKKQQPTHTDSVYIGMQNAFIGHPDTAIVKPLVRSVLAKYGSELINDDPQEVAKVLVGLRKASKVGVTEMDILKHVYQRGDRCNDLHKQFFISAVYLEHTK